MKTDIFTLCDSAQDYNGKMVIVGTCNKIVVASISSPASFAMAIRVILEGEDSLVLPLSLSIANCTTGQEAGPPITWDVPNQDAGKNIGFLNLVLNFGRFVFPAPGQYKALLKIKDQEWTTEFYIEERQSEK